ncbi:MAG: ATP-binding protein [Candidatus Nanoarchaeia archaeon]|nr:ATP-binding protein [Candidatus Nanoarchaeia archaeon]
MKKIKFPRGFLENKLICYNQEEKMFLTNEIKNINPVFKSRIIVSNNFENSLLKNNHKKKMYFLDKLDIIYYFEKFLNILKIDEKFSNILEMNFNNKNINENDEGIKNINKNINKNTKKNNKSNKKNINNFLKIIEKDKILFEKNVLDEYKKNHKEIIEKYIEKISIENSNSYYKGIKEFSNQFKNLKMKSQKDLIKITKKYSKKSIKSKEKIVYKIDDLVFDKNNFINYVEEKVFLTIDYILKSLKKRDKNFKNKFNDKNKKINLTIATSGGKDSLTVLSLLKKYSDNHNDCFQITALCIDEGIAGYRPHTIDDLNDFCKKIKINYKVISFKDVFKIDLDSAVKKSNLLPCNICGVFRRQSLNLGALENDSDIIATGHNFDDELQAFKMNLIKNNNDQFYKMGPITGFLSIDDGFVQRIKPLYFVTEKEVLIYSILQKFKVKYNECPYAYASFRGKIRDIINEIGYNKIESFNFLFSCFEYIKNIKNVKSKKNTKNKKDKNNNNKDNINNTNNINKINSTNNTNNQSIGRCEICNQPSSNKICKACLLKKDLLKDDFVVDNKEIKK